VDQAAHQEHGSDATSINIHKLAAQASTGSRDAFEQLVEHFERRIFNFLYLMTRNVHDAEDLTQITFLKAYQGIQGYHFPHAFSAWLFTIARRTAFNHFRGARQVEQLDDQTEATLDNPGAILERKDEWAAIWQRAKTLKRNQYEALWLRYGEGFSISETARIMRTNPIRVRVLVHRGRAALASKLAATEVNP
jgi:RNA polymerase sigma-70 factor, ECF subfamily